MESKLQTDSIETLNLTEGAIDPLKKFLENYKSKEKGVFTHTWLGFPKGSYDIPNDALPELFHLLHKRMFIQNKEAHLTEKPCNPSNLKIDLDFRYDIDVNKRQHTPAIIAEVVKLYNQVINEYLDVLPERLNAYIFERKCGYKIKGYTRDGVHIMYPDIVASVEAQHAIRKRVLEQCDVIFSKLPLKNTNDDVIDRAVIGDNNWLVYGCTKPNLPRYKLVTIYDHQLEQLPITNDHLTLMIHLSNFNPHKEQFEVKVKPEKASEVNWLDLHRHSKPNKAKVNVEKQKKVYLSKGVEDARRLIRMLSPHRSEGYHDWIHVGWCLHNIDHGLLQDWIEFSQLSEKYREGECEKIWHQARDEGFGLPALHRWARQDSPEEYEQYWRDHLFAYIEMALSGATFDVATVLHQMFRYRYVCAAYKHNIWYEFKNHRWHEIDSAESLRGRLSNEVLNEFCHMNVYFNQSAIDETDARKGQFIVKSDQLNAVSLKLRDVKFKDKVIDEARNLFYDANFIKKLDKAPDLIGFENGVYDLSMAEFRDGRPEDYISLTTGNDYIEFEGNEPVILELYDFMSKVFPIERVRDYVFMLLSSFLLGSNQDQKFHIWTGCHAKDTPIMMADGRLKMVQNIQIGERLMGDDSKPRTVLRLVRGHSDMYKITPDRGDFSYVVNGDHILCLKATNMGSVVWSEQELQYKVTWHERDLLGYPKVCTKIFPISAYQQAIDYLNKIRNQNTTINNGDIIEIPVRKYIEFKNRINKNYCAYRAGIDLPENNVELNYSFSIEKVEDDDYYGFTVDGNHRYLMGDYTVTHNCGSNGKSLLVSLFESAFGKYCAKLPVSLLTQKRAASNSASPELARTVGARFVSLQEPDENERMNIGLMKEITGGDTIQTRPMYREPIEFKPQFKMVLCCNHLPKLPPNDDGTWRRIRVVDFISKFVDEPDPTIPYQYKINRQLTDRFPEWKPAFMFILLEHHKIFREQGMKIVEPPEVKAATKEYQKISDIFVEFRDENLERNNNGTIKLNETYAKFRLWYKANYDTKAPSSRDFRDNMEKHLGTKYHTRQGWQGWSFIPEDDGLDDTFDGVTENNVPKITPAEFRSNVPPPKTSQVTPVLTMQKSVAPLPTKTPETTPKSSKIKTPTPKLKAL